MDELWLTNLDAIMAFGEKFTGLSYLGAGDVIISTYTCASVIVFRQHVQPLKRKQL